MYPEKRSHFLHLCRVERMLLSLSRWSALSHFLHLCRVESLARMNLALGVRLTSCTCAGLKDQSCQRVVGYTWSHFLHLCRVER